MIDPEAPTGFRDADFDQREMEAVGARTDALARRGVCTHGSTVGYVGTAFYPEQEGLQPGQVRCRDCGATFDSDDAWLAARQAVID